MCPEVDSLVHQLATGKGEFFDYVDALNPQVSGRIAWKVSEISRSLAQLLLIYLDATRGSWHRYWEQGRY